MCPNVSDHGVDQHLLDQTTTFGSEIEQVALE